MPKTNATQSQHPWRATVRTVVAAVIGVAALLPFLVDAAGVDETLPAVAGVLAVAGAITRIMALPQVDAFLERFVPWLATGDETVKAEKVRARHR